MSKIPTVLALLLGLVCWGQPSIAAPDADDSGTPASAVPTPQVDGTGAQQGGWRRHHRMQADSTSQATDTNTGAGLGAGKGPGAGRGQGLGAGRGQGLGRGGGRPNFKGVMGLQSLTPDQRQKIKGIVEGLKKDRQALQAQMASAGSADGGAPGSAPAKGAPAASAGGGDAQANPELRKQMHQKTMAAWQQIKGMLTPAQTTELEQSGNNGQLVAPKGGAQTTPRAGKPGNDPEG